MTTTRSIDECIGCKKQKEVEKRRITLPTGHVATSHDLMCDECYATLREALKPTGHE